MRRTVHIQALWDAEAKVWGSRGDVPGLVVETATLAQFEALMQALAPELPADNGGRLTSAAFQRTAADVLISPPSGWPRWRAGPSCRQGFQRRRLPC